MQLAPLDDTIVAISTPLGYSGIGLVRLSGPEAVSIVGSVAQLVSLKKLGEVPSHTVHLAKLMYQQTMIDEVMLTVMRAPKSYTGDDVVEIGAHGNPLVLQKIVEICVACGARPAQAGEFTQRAFFNGKKDLVQAESVLDMVHVKSERALQKVLQQLEGQWSAEIRNLRSQLEELVIYLEAELDFSEEQIDFLDEEAFQNKALALFEQLDFWVESYQRAVYQRQGVVVTLVGEPNVGKSSLFNALARQAKAIVTDVPGTTRDILEHVISLEGIPFRFLDTAGIRETEDVIEREGVARSLKMIEISDIVIYVIDSTRLENISLIKKEILKIKEDKNKKSILLINKIDLNNIKINKDDLLEFDEVLSVSAKTLTGIAQLEERMVQLAAGNALAKENEVFINERQWKLLKESRGLMEQIAHKQLKGQQELIVIDLRTVLQNLHYVLGDIYTDDILNQIFAKFCIGK